MIVRGKHQGCVGKILDKDKKNDSLQVQLMNDEFQIVRISFDDGCALAPL